MQNRPLGRPRSKRCACAHHTPPSSQPSSPGTEFEKRRRTFKSGRTGDQPGLVRRPGAHFPKEDTQQTPERQRAKSNETAQESERIHTSAQRTRVENRDPALNADADIEKCIETAIRSAPYDSGRSRRSLEQASKRQFGACPLAQI